MATYQRNIIFNQTTAAGDTRHRIPEGLIHTFVLIGAGAGEAIEFKAVDPTSAPENIESEAVSILSSQDTIDVNRKIINSANNMIQIRGPIELVISKPVTATPVTLYVQMQ
jgi:hypothetical protein